MSDFDPRTMIFFDNRLKTYGNWIYKNNKNAKCTAEKMARAGFYLPKNETDSAKCFVCLKTLDGWEVDDDPFGEHRKHTPSTGCPYIQLGKFEEGSFTVLELIDLAKQMCLNINRESFRDAKKKLDDLREKMIKELTAAEKKC